MSAAAGFAEGVYFIPYLDPGNYYGIDSNASLIEAGYGVNIPRHALQGGLTHLLVAEDFGAWRFGPTSIARSPPALGRTRQSTTSTDRSAEIWSELRGYDERFTCPGGGFGT